MPSLGSLLPSLPGWVAGLLVGLTPATPTSPVQDLGHWQPCLGLATKKRGIESSVDPIATAVPSPVLLHAQATLVNLHTHEIVLLTDTQPSQRAFSRFLRDRVTGESVEMAPRLLELLRQVAKPDQHGPVRVEFISGYRSWKLNEWLRKKGHHVASHSQHSLGHAMDFRIGGLTSKQLAERIEKLHWRGGLAYYPGSHDRFVHVDVGPNRRWKGR